MRFQIGRFCVVVLALIFLDVLGGQHRLAAQADQRPVAFLGTWVLNAELSDDLRPRPEISGSDRDR